MHADIPVQPSPWLARDVENDRSWVLRLTADEIHGIDTALAHAKKTAKPLLDMTPGDFPLSEAARNKLASAVRATQTRWGFCLLKGFPVDRWSEEDTRLAYWGMGLHMGVARPQNRNSDILNDVRDAGGTLIVSPNMDPQVIAATKEIGLHSWPGVMTPTECFAALKAGAI